MSHEKPDDVEAPTTAKSHDEQDSLSVEKKSEVTAEETSSGEDGLSSIPTETEEEEENLDLKLDQEKEEETATTMESDAKLWFDGLSAKERACAVGFVDGPFLAMVLAMASWSPAAAEPRRTADGSFPAHGAKHHITWSEPVSLDDVEATYSRFLNGDESAATPDQNYDVSGTKISSDKSASQGTPTRSVLAESAGEAKPSVESDEFRIRKSNDSGAVVVEAAKSQVAPADHALSDDIPSIQSVFDHISVVFPCVFKLSSESSPAMLDDDDKNPYLTLQPSFLEKLKSEELFLAFDAAMRTVSDVGFLSKEPNADSPNAWLERLQQACTNNDYGTPSESSSLVLPMYAVVLARIELAVFEAYRDQAPSGPRDADVSTTEPSPALPVDESSCTSHGDEVVVATSNSAATTSEAKTGTAGEGADANIITKRATCDLRQMETVASYARDLHGQGITAEALRDVAKPFVKACFGPKSHYHVDIPRLVLMPLSWILHARRDTSPAIDLNLLDRSLCGVLKALSNRGTGDCNSKKEIAPGSDNYVSEDKAAPTGDNRTLKEAIAPSRSNRTLKEQAMSESSNRSLKDGSVTDGKLATCDDGTSKDGSAPDGDSPTSKGGVGASETQAPSTTATQEAGNTTPSSTNSKKKRKKRKKNRQKKNKTNAEAASGTKETSHHSDHAGSSKEKSTSSTVDAFKDTTVEATLQTTPSGDSQSVEVVAPMESPSSKSDVSTPVGSPSCAESTDTASQASSQQVGTIGATEVQTADIEEERKQPVSTETTKPATAVEQQEDNDVWETVEVRSRNNRKKPSTISGSRAGGMSTMVGGMSPDAKRTKEKRTAQTRRRNATRKIVRDILSSVLDTVDEEVRKKKARPLPPSPHRVTGNAWKTGPLTAPRSRLEAANGESKTAVTKNETTLRDVVLGRHTAASKIKQRLPTGTAAAPLRGEKSSLQGGEAAKLRLQPSTPARTAESPTKSRATKWNKVAAMTSVDQNTAPTYQETVSAVSATSNAAAGRKGQGSPSGKLPETEWGLGEMAEPPPNKERVSSPPDKAQSPAPPLPTLLSPENANSATSSVASSLEVPHSNRRHHSTSVPDVNDVGYHLLDVCDRLSKDMGLFMQSRAQALNVRRRERTALLVSLQETLTNIWPGMCNVEMYGSCATLLDLPSSDLDVLVMGLDRNLDMMMGTGAGTPQHNFEQDKAGKTDTASPTNDITATEDEPQSTSQAHNHPHGHSGGAPSYVALPGYQNAERVTRLAGELESQPWAVKVKSIPYASVPVIKILADPSKLPGSGPSVDWMMHSQYGAQSYATQGHPASTEDTGPSALQNKSPQHLFEPWRGSDVMNGLISLDISFEGPEHGGIGSTEFSMHVVNEACQEYGTPPESTPFVQCLMVLKELLAQRKLNEPYSGGLSSYALLLLLVSLVRERAIIREELERAERQRQAMTASDVSSYGPGGTVEKRSASQGATHHSAKRPDSQGPARQYSQAGKEGKQNATSKSDTTKITPNAWGDNPKSGKQTAKSPKKLSNQSPRLSTSSTEVKQSSSSSASSWACIAKKRSNDSSTKISTEKQQTVEGKVTREQSQVQNVEKKPFSFADAVARSASKSTMSSSLSTDTSDTHPVNKKSTKSTKYESKRPANRADNKGDSTPNDEEQEQPCSLLTSDKAFRPSPLSVDPSLSVPSYFPQGVNDVIEVLCSGETTAGKLLMHFLLYYGEHFDAQTTAIDISGKHDRGFANQMSPYSYLSPYFQRRANETIDPHTGMLVVDHIVVYDPLEGAEGNNVARRCFAWSQVKWIFAQSYATLSSAVERSSTPPTTPGAPSRQSSCGAPTSTTTATTTTTTTTNCTTTAPTDTRVEGDNATRGEPAMMGDLMDPSSPLLRCLLAF